jgi:acetyltransferase
VGARDKRGHDDSILTALGMTSANASAIERLFNPRNVALVGASDRTDHWSRRVFDNLHRFGYAGKVFPVNPNRSEIWDVPCFPTLSALPETPDHIAIYTPAETSLQVLREGAAAGARSATFYAAGFGEGGDTAGLRLGQELRTIIETTGITVIGPNCMGLASGKSGFSTIPDETLQPLAPSAVAVAAQSGALCASINRAVNELGLKISYFASCGGQIGCKVSEFIDYFADQPELRVILCYIEAIPDAERFLAAARRARINGKTVVAVKIGGSETARAFALAHTGSLVGTAEAFEAVAMAAGVVRFSTLEDALEAVEFLARSPLPRGRNIAVMTNSGALRNLITEAAERSRATLAPLSAGTQAALGKALGQADITNPLDTKRTIPTAQYVACIDALLAAPEVDIVLTAEDLPLDDGAERRVANLRSLEGASARAAAAAKTVTAFTPFTISKTEYGRNVRAQLPSVPFLRDTERTLRVIRALAEAGARPINAQPPVSTPETDVTRAWRRRAAALKHPTALNEVDSKALLRAYGIPMPNERVVATEAEAELAAREIGFPVVMKAVSAALPHKSDAGLVILNVADAEGVRQAVATLTARISALNAPLDGILIAQQISGGVETVLGVKRDVEMGPVVMFGLGGIYVELFKDVSFAPAGLDLARAEQMVRATRAGRLLDGYRGGKPGDVGTLSAALVGLGRLALELGDAIEAIDINPFLVCERGRGGFALDGLVVLRPLSS